MCVCVCVLFYCVSRLLFLFTHTYKHHLMFMLIPETLSREKRRMESVCVDVLESSRPPSGRISAQPFCFLDSHLSAQTRSRALAHAGAPSGRGTFKVERNDLEMAQRRAAFVVCFMNTNATVSDAQRNQQPDMRASEPEGG